MSVRITIDQLQEQLPELLNRAAQSGETYVIERDGEECAVLVGAREWRARNPEPGQGDPSPSGNEDEDDQERRLLEIGAKLDALGPEYRLSPAKQARAEELLSRKSSLNRAESRELSALLRESDAIMLRRAEAISSRAEQLSSFGLCPSG